MIFFAKQAANALTLVLVDSYIVPGPDSGVKVRAMHTLPATVTPLSAFTHRGSEASCLQPGSLLISLRKGESMSQRGVMDKLSIYIPQKHLADKPVQRLIELGLQRDRGVNYLVVEAILQYLAQEEERP